MNFEAMEKRVLFAADIGLQLASLPVEPDSVEASEFFTADSFSFGVEREMKESGEKGGTADMNIGIGELQECTISKSMDASAVDFALQEFAGETTNPATAGDLTTGEAPEPVGLLLPAVQAAREAARRSAVESTGIMAEMSEASHESESPSDSTFELEGDHGTSELNGGLNRDIIRRKV